MSFNEQKKVSFKCSENIPISNITSGQNLITISKEQEILFDIDGITPSHNADGNAYIFLYHGNFYEKSED